MLRLLGDGVVGREDAVMGGCAVATQILIMVISLILGGCIGWVIAGLFHKKQMHASKQSQEEITTYFQRLESKMTEGFKILLSVLNPGRVLTPEEETNLRKASATIASALFEPIYAAGTILAGDTFVILPGTQKTTEERND